MKKDSPIILNSISEFHSLLNLKKPTHPLVSVIKLDDLAYKSPEEIQLIYNFYTINLKKNFDGKMEYGQQYYDFDDGTMSFFAPKQSLSIEANSTQKAEGWMLVFHPDFLQSYPLATRIKEYGFFSYATNEALHLSD